MNRLIVLVAVAALSSGCAKRPNAIAPVLIPPETYAGYECSHILAEMAIEDRKLAELSKVQNDAATGDAFGVFVLGVPMASAMGGDKEAEIAVSKGRYGALGVARLRKGC